MIAASNVAKSLRRQHGSVGNLISWALQHQAASLSNCSNASDFYSIRPMNDFSRYVLLRDWRCYSSVGNVCSPTLAGYKCHRYIGSVRGLAVSHRKKDSKKGKGRDRKNDIPLMNRDLRSSLDRMNVTEVRLRLELHDGERRKPELVTVDEAFKTAEDFQLNIVEVALNIDVPVVEVKEFTVSVFLAKKSC